MSGESAKRPSLYQTVAPWRSLGRGRSGALRGRCASGLASPGAGTPQPIRVARSRRGGSGIGGHETPTEAVTKLWFLPQHTPLPRIAPRSPGATGRGRSGVDAGGQRERGAAAAEPRPCARRPGPPGQTAMADGGGTGSSGPWWKSLTNSRKKSKEAAVGAQPPPQPAPAEPAPPAPPSPDWTGSSRAAGDTHKPDKLVAEKSGSSRRNLKISRSGRFKEKRKVRATLLPEGVRSLEEAGFPGDPQDDKQ